MVAARRFAKGRRAPHVLNAVGMAVKEAGGGDSTTEVGGSALIVAALVLSAKLGDPVNFVVLAGLSEGPTPVRNVFEDSAALVNLAHTRKLSSLLGFLGTFHHVVLAEIIVEVLIAVAVDL